MMTHRTDDLPSLLERLARTGVRRRPRHGLDSQVPRCPLCNRAMVAYVSVRGPAWLCGCNEPARLATPSPAVGRVPAAAGGGAATS